MRSAAHFEMQVRPGGVARAAHARDGFAARDAPAGGDEVLRVVRVDGDQIALVRQEHEISVAPLLPREDHHAVGGGADGRPFRAAADGVVIFAGQQRGYGNLVLLAHEGDLVTVYAHNSQNLVAPGRRVARGEPIARVGRTGNATGPHL